MSPTPEPGHPFVCGYYSLVRWLAAGLLLFIVFVVGGVALAHTDEELDAWTQDWTARVVAAGDVTSELLDDWRDMAERHPCHFLNECGEKPRTSGQTSRRESAAPRTYGPGVEQWRSLAAAHFQSGDVWRVLCLMRHESGGNPDAQNPSSGASGLMQVMPWWAGQLGISRADLFDPDRNLWAARQIYDRQGWGAWSPYKRGLCR